ncbi:1-(5-phosphoribosyl)-5-[(5-phosphoribosylamino)methylideneamino]imidazole-4-carboxamide isomerase [Oribacterium sp. HCP28S3_H8]|uniref:1-(5-phosphoribosyl)-5-[(5- phosphoribosylamino)methylideneamino]imidazole-4- carboxamide isomerase n=1 Tax=Oribacterium sp. HCP28S3_H8 TaxID=3438945 RepID=UPI003F8CAB8B
MQIFPAIDLYDKKVVRLVKGDYKQMTVYSEHPLETAEKIEALGGKWLHLVDLEGAKDGTTPNFDVVKSICQGTGLNVEIGGGIRSLDTMQRYLEAGVARVILGTKAVTDEAFLKDALREFGDKVAVGVDARNGKVAVKGWLEILDVDMMEFLRHLETLGVRTAIVTDISRDGAMQGTNLPLYKELAKLTGLNITASGGISSLAELKALRDMQLYGAILGKAMYTGAVSLEDALALVKE